MPGPGGTPKPEAENRPIREDAGGSPILLYGGRARGWSDGEQASQCRQKESTGKGMETRKDRYLRHTTESPGCFIGWRVGFSRSLLEKTQW